MTPPNESLNAHDRFSELAAMATSGELTGSECAELNDHLLACEACSEVYRQYRILANEGFPMLAAGYEHREATARWDQTLLRRKLSARIGELTSSSTTVHSDSPSPARRYPVRAILGAAVAACLVIGAGIGGWRLGRS